MRKRLAKSHVPTADELAEMAMRGKDVTKHYDIKSLKVREPLDKIEMLQNKKIPKREQWLFNNPEALASVLRGIADAKAGRTVRRPAFKKRKK